MEALLSTCIEPTAPTEEVNTFNNAKASPPSTPADSQLCSEPGLEHDNEEIIECSTSKLPEVDENISFAMLTLVVNLMAIAYVARNAFSKELMGNYYVNFVELCFILNASCFVYTFFSTRFLGLNL